MNAHLKLKYLVECKNRIKINISVKVKKTTIKQHVSKENCVES